MIETERFAFVFAKTGSINSGTGLCPAISLYVIYQGLFVIPAGSKIDSSQFIIMENLKICIAVFLYVGSIMAKA